MHVTKIARLSRRRIALRTTLVAVPTAIFVATSSRAAGTGMPWEQPLQQILDSVQGPVAKIVAVIVIITTGLTLAFGEMAGGFRRLIQIVFGGAVLDLSAGSASGGTACGEGGGGRKAGRSGDRPRPAPFRLCDHWR